MTAHSQIEYISHYGECDCCQRKNVRLEQCWTSCGIETWACAECRGDKDDMEQDQ